MCFAISSGEQAVNTRLHLIEWTQPQATMEGRMQRLRPVLVVAAMCMLSMQGHAAPSGIVGTENAKFKLGERYFTPVGANMCDVL